MTAVVAALAVWVASGLVAAWVLARLGHNFWLLAAMGLAFGPFVLLIWFEGARGQPTSSRLVRVGDPSDRSGWIDVLVGLDGTDAAVASTQHVLATLGPALRRIWLSSVLDHEISNAPEMFATDDQRIEYLKAAAERLDCPDAEVMLASGQPAKALLDQAVEHGVDMLIVAHRRQTVASELRGSTVSRLTRDAEIPVLIGPPAS